MTTAEPFLRELYFNPRSPASYSNLNKMWQEVRSSGRPIKYQEVKAFLENFIHISITQANNKKIYVSKNYAINNCRLI